MIKIKIGFLLLLFFVTLLSGRSQQIEIGQKAPPWSLETVINSSQKLPFDWSDFRGEALVIDFWGTWCRPCIQTLPHMNRLASQFKNRPIQFVAITDEELSTVRNFLQKHPIDAWIGIDADRSMFDSYGVWSVPYTVLIDSSGVIRDLTHPVEVTVEKLEDLIGDRLLWESQPPRHETVSQILLLPSESENSLRREGRLGALQLTGYPFIELIAEVYGYPVDQILTEFDPPKGRFDVMVPPGQGKIGLLLLKKILESSLNFRARTFEKEGKKFLSVKRP